MKQTIDGVEYKVSYKHWNFSYRGKNRKTIMSSYLPDVNYLYAVKHFITRANETGQIQPYMDVYNSNVVSGNTFMNIQGITICELAINRVVKGMGFAFCGPGDQFYRKEGRRISLNRATEDLKTKNPKDSIIYGDVK